MVAVHFCTKYIGNNYLGLFYPTLLTLSTPLFGPTTPIHRAPKMVILVDLHISHWWPQTHHVEQIVWSLYLSFIYCFRAPKVILKVHVKVGTRDAGWRGRTALLNGSCVPALFQVRHRCAVLRHPCELSSFLVNVRPRKMRLKQVKLHVIRQFWVLLQDEDE